MNDGKIKIQEGLEKRYAVTISKIKMINIQRLKLNDAINILEKLPLDIEYVINVWTAEGVIAIYDRYGKLLSGEDK